MGSQYICQAQAYGQIYTDPEGELHGFGDDSFMEEITRQILLLTTDEDETIPEHNRRSSGFSRASRRGSDGLITYTSFQANPQPGSYFYWSDNNKEGGDIDSVPAWMLSLWRKGNGTGVFIPQTKTRRRDKHGRMNNGRKRGYRNVLENN